MEFEAWAGQSLGACVSRGSTLRRDAPASRAADRRGASRPSPPWRRRVPERPTEVNGDRRRVSRLFSPRGDLALTPSFEFWPTTLFRSSTSCARRGRAHRHAAARRDARRAESLRPARRSRVRVGGGVGSAREVLAGTAPALRQREEARVPDLGTTGRTETRVRSRRGPRSPRAVGHHGSHRARGDAQLR